MVSFASGDRGIIARSSVGGKLGGGELGDQTRYIHLGHGLEMAGGLYAVNGPGTYKGK